MSLRPHCPECGSRLLPWGGLLCLLCSYNPLAGVAAVRTTMCRATIASLLRAFHYLRNQDLEVAEWRMNAITFAVLSRQVGRIDRGSTFVRYVSPGGAVALMLLGAPIIIDERVPCRRVEIVPRQYGRGSEYREMAWGRKE